MRAPPLWPAVELPVGPRNAALGGGTACGHPHWGFGGALCGATKRCPGRGTAWGRPHWGLRWSPLWSHEAPPWVGEPHAGTPTGAYGGAPYGATKRCPGLSLIHI
eukprot:1360124-Pyramimonas_sp.AAC.1